ncbi:hypothetical protein HYDPIDRAFT_30827 [Hydnomerulius pinastri MD-312]|uniref:Uncharacterized protein n=1 Tax=Hydnomerulius pinastri MD-312 TaxID=994086 RepID=A0A0C9WCY0_9AGAM|nr:hypothetical protein HYDPIDRAFT_30827 [Hydnomerulius pinastri MD-312]
MDVDWCLSCERRIDDFPSTSGPYCSPECLSYAQPSSSSRILPPPPATSGDYRIRQWAQAIPPHVPAGAPSRPFTDSAACPPASTLVAPFELSPPSPRSRQQPTPKLIERAAVSTPLPTLCVSSPAHVRPLPPTRATSRMYSQPTPHTNTTASMSEASTSLTSLLSEPMVATPDEDCSFGANIGALVRSWVHRDRDSSTKAIKEEYVIEKVADYFPSVPQVKKNSSPASSSKKSKKTQSPSSAPIFRYKSPAKKITPSHERDHSTPTHSHTPTPVVFPSCRAVELDWDDDEDDDIAVAPPAQYDYRQTHEAQRPHLEEDIHWTRAPSPAASVSSTGSSVLLMAPKRWDGIRGRKDGRAIAA